MEERKRILEEIIEILNKEYQRTIPKCGTGIYKHYWRMSEDCLKKYEELVKCYQSKEDLKLLEELEKHLKTMKEKRETWPAKNICRILLGRESKNNDPHVIICK